MKGYGVDWKRSWYRLPLLPFRIFFLTLSYYVFKPIAFSLEIIGSSIPGLERKYK